MHLFLLGASHHSAPVDLRERIDFERRGVADALAGIADLAGIGEVVVLSTCNRSEIYTACEAPEPTREALTAFMSGFHDVPEPELARRGTCSVWSPDSIRWSSASRRSSVR